MNRFILLLFCSFVSISLYSQEDLLSLLNDSLDAKVKEPVTATFKTTRVINLPSIEQTAAGVFDFKISHRFGFLSSGVREFFGLDQASIRIGGEYGISKGLMIGVGRSSFEKTVDGYFKWRLFKQTSGYKSFPLTVSVFGGSAIKTVNTTPDRTNFFVNNLFYTGQLIIGSKLTEGLSLQISPTVVHRNLTLTTNEKNDVLAVGAGGRIKLSKRTSLNAEYIYLLPNQISSEYKPSLSIGFDIETGGHVFQLHASNSTSMIEKGYIAETVGDWGQGDIHFGFNISRVFTIRKPTN
ncbi:MAG: hypothetical protein IPO25_08525 [Saprospiraceae bacterium]|nr:hypothetical protein [Saprospiraceae bacterium]